MVIHKCRVEQLKASDIPENLDELIAREKRALIREYFEDVWTELKNEGLETPVIVETFVEAALDRLANESGSEEASRLIAHIKNLEEMGFLPADRTIQ